FGVWISLLCALGPRELRSMSASAMTESTLWRRCDEDGMLCILVFCRQKFSTPITCNRTFHTVEKRERKINKIMDNSGRQYQESTQSGRHRISSYIHADRRSNANRGTHENGI